MVKLFLWMGCFERTNATSILLSKFRCGLFSIETIFPRGQADVITKWLTFLRGLEFAKKLPNWPINISREKNSRYPLRVSTSFFTRWFRAKLLTKAKDVWYKKNSGFIIHLQCKLPPHNPSILAHFGLIYSCRFPTDGKLSRYRKNCIKPVKEVERMGLRFFRVEWSN